MDSFEELKRQKAEIVGRYEIAQRKEILFEVRDWLFECMNAALENGYEDTYDALEILIDKFDCDFELSIEEIEEYEERKT